MPNELGTYSARVRFQNPGPATPDGDGGYVESWIDCVPAEWKVSLTQATTASLERIAAGTVISTATHLVEGAFHPQVSTLTRMTHGDQVYAITGKVASEGRTMICGAVAVVV
jgi:head-tail adaptor